MMLLSLLSFVALPLLLFCVVAASRRLLGSIRMRRRGQLIASSLPVVLAQMASAMQAGSSFAVALNLAVDESDGPLAEELVVVLQEQRLGTPLEEALQHLSRRVSLEEMDLMVCATTIARETGGNLAEVFLRLSGSLQRQLDIRARIKALTAQGVLQGWVVSLLPAVMVVALWFIEPSAMRPLVSGLLGWLCIVVVIVLELAGALMIRRIVAIDV